ncbi:MAG: hypothetical protein KDB27_24890 [Planctomycetales bacterium]|nr:hypothetical protein [Planctomycetales bacterium]
MARWQLVLSVALLKTLVSCSCLAEATKSSLPLIDPGTTIDSQKNVSGGSQLVLLAKPRVAAGDVDSASAKVKKYAAMFCMAIVAEVQKNESGEYIIKSVAVGNCVTGDDGWTVVSADSHKDVGVDLDFFARQVLSRSEASLRKTRIVASSDTYRIFDADAVVKSGTDHQHMKIRHFVWVNRKSGKLAMIQWLLRDSVGSKLQLVENVVHALPSGYVEDRVFSVKSEEFTLGFPSEKALAIAKLPTGRQLQVSEKLKKLASADSYSEETQLQLIDELNRAIQQARN